MISLSSCSRKLRTVLSLAILVLGISGSADAAAMYSVTDLGANTIYTGLNDLGQATGSGPLYDIGHNDIRDELLYSNGQTIDAGASTGALQTNARGQILEINYRRDSTGAPTDFSYAIREPDGAVHSIAGLQPYETPLAINNQGQVFVQGSGNSSTNTYSILTNGQRQPVVQLDGTHLSAFSLTGFGPNGVYSGVVERGIPGRAESFSVFGDLNGYQIGLQDRGAGAIVAYSNNGLAITNYKLGTLQNVYLSRSTDLGFNLKSLNNAGVVVGNFEIQTGGQVAGVSTNGSAQDLNKLIPPTGDFKLTDALQINNLGQILAVGTVDNVNHSFLLTPQTVPEPSSLLIVASLVGFGGVAVRRQRHRSLRSCGPGD